MTATTSNLNIPHQPTEPRTTAYPMAASATIYKDSFVMLSSGYLTSATNTSSKIFAGVAKEYKLDSTASNGGTYAEVYTDKNALFKVYLSGAAVTDVGAPVFLSDNATITKTPTWMPAGRIIKKDPDVSNYVWIDIRYAGDVNPWETINLGPCDLVDATDGRVYLGNTGGGYVVPDAALIYRLWGEMLGSTTVTPALSIHNGTTTLVSSIGTTVSETQANLAHAISNSTTIYYIAKGGEITIEFDTATSVTSGQIAVELRIPK